MASSISTISARPQPHARGLSSHAALTSSLLSTGGCGARLPVVHALERAPRVFMLQLAWQSQREEAADIAATLSAVGETVGIAGYQIL